MNKRLLSKAYNVSLLLGFLVLSLSSVNVGERNESQPIAWVTIEEVENLIKEEPRKVFVDVYTTWCGPCKLMDRTTFKDEKVTDYIEANYYAVKLNADSPNLIKFRGKQISEKDLAQSFQVQGYPTIILMDEELGSIKSTLGYMKAGQFKRLLEDYNQNN